MFWVPFFLLFFTPPLFSQIANVLHSDTFCCLPPGQRGQTALPLDRPSAGRPLRGLNACRSPARRRVKPVCRHPLRGHWATQRLETTARAVVRAKRDPHQSRQACFTFVLEIEFSQRVLTLASWDRKDCVSVENLPPTSTPMSWRVGQPTLGLLSRRLALVTLAPSSTAARVVGRPSLLRAQTKGQQPASASEQRRPSTTTSSLLPPVAAPGRATSRSCTNTVGCDTTASHTTDAS